VRQAQRPRRPHGTPRARAAGNASARPAGDHLSTTALGKEIVGALYADVSERVPAIAGALPADEQDRLAGSVARITASARLAGSPVPDAG
jgi:hypothetical protein